MQRIVSLLLSVEGNLLLERYLNGRSGIHRVNRSVNAVVGKRKLKLRRKFASRQVDAEGHDGGAAPEETTMEKMQENHARNGIGNGMHLDNGKKSFEGYCEESLLEDLHRDMYAYRLNDLVDHQVRFLRDLVDDPTWREIRYA